MQIDVKQHIYSNVAKDRSPNNKRGYQTLFCSSGIAREDVFRLEERVLYAAGETAPVKWQFHPVGPWQVVTRVVALAGRDEFGRKGRYLAHSLLLEAEQFAMLDCAPVPLLHDAFYYDDLDAVFAVGDMRGGQIAAARLTVDSRWQEQAENEARRWSSALRDLLCVGWNAETLAADEMIELVGDAADIIAAMQVLFLYTPLEKRHLLTFDSHALNCDWKPGKPFRLAANLVRRKPAAVQIDCGRYTVRNALPTQATTPMERWAESLIGARLPLYRMNEPVGRTLAAVVAGARMDISAVDRMVGSTFAEANRAAVVERVLQTVPVAISDELRGRWGLTIEEDPWGALQQAAVERSFGEDAGRLYKWISVGPRITIS